jgi:hypothetical protein
VEYFNYLVNVITNDAKCTTEIKSSIAKEKSAFNKKIFHQQIARRFKAKINEVIHLEHDTVWC